MIVNILHPFVLAGMLAFSAFPAPAPALAAADNPLPEQCVRGCAPNLFFTPVDYSIWIVSTLTWSNGEALEFCEPCKPCKELVLISYFGSAPTWSVTGATGGAGGNGQGYCTMRLQTDCDSPSLGALHGTAGPGQDLTVQLYCYCWD